MTSYPASHVKVIKSSEDPVKRIVIAEDHKKTREALSALLERKGFEVLAVQTADEALALLSDPDGPSLALLDWMLAEGTGLDVCRAVRGGSFARYVYLIVITARDGEEDVARALASGADDFIRKPCNASELVARVRTGQRIVDLERHLAHRIDDLQSALTRVQQLKRLLPICMYCKKVRDDSDYWREIDEYIHAEAGTDFSHGICPACAHGFLNPSELGVRKVSG